jgi:hypothetical protein
VLLHLQSLPDARDEVDLLAEVAAESCHIAAGCVAEARPSRCKKTSAFEMAGGCAKDACRALGIRCGWGGGKGEGWSRRTASGPSQRDGLKVGVGWGGDGYFELNAGSNI